MRRLDEIRRELDQATERRTQLWKVLGAGADEQRSSEVGRLNVLIEALWHEAREARNSARFGEKDTIIRRAKAEERLERDLGRVA